MTTVVVGHRCLNVLTVRDVLELSDRVNERARAAVLSDCVACGLSPLDRVTALRELDRTRDLTAAVLRYAYTAAGAVDILGVALRRSGSSEAAETVLDGESPDRWTEIALMLLGAGSAEGKASTPEAAG